MKHCFFYLIILFFLTSCETTNWITIKVQKPAQIVIPPSVQNIIIVNNSAVQPDDVGHKNRVYTKDEDISVSSDSINIILIEALAQFMNEENYFRSVAPYGTALRENETFLTEEIIKPEILNKIAENTQSDAIISLDRIILRSTQQTSNIGNSLMSEDLCVNINANFRIYLVSERKTLPMLSFKDSICWNGIRQGDTFFTEDYPSRPEALKLAALYTADRMTKMISPFWQEEGRIYYPGLSKEADLKASTNEWKDAAILWGNLFESEKKENKKAKLAANIALANEMLDDIENALSWTDISLELFVSNQKIKDDRNVSYLTLYKQVLEQRINDFKNLDKQQNIN